MAQVALTPYGPYALHSGTRWVHVGSVSGLLVMAHVLQILISRNLANP